MWSSEDIVHRYKVGELVWIGSSKTIGLILELVPAYIVGDYEGGYKLLINEELVYRSENILTLVKLRNYKNG